MFMSHHAPCSNLLMLLTCLSPSPSCSFPLLFLSPLTFPLFTSDALSLSPSLSGEGEMRGAYFYPNSSPSPEKLRLDAREMRSSQWLYWSLRAADLYFQCLSRVLFTLLRLKVQLVFRSPTAAWISRFPPQLALSKKNTLDEFQAKVWQLFHFKLRLRKEENLEMNSTSKKLHTTTYLLTQYKLLVNIQQYKSIW